MKVLFVDTYNLLHISRHGFAKGEYNIVFNFFRKLKPILEKFNADKLYFTLEGHPQFRFDLYPQYKEKRRQKRAMLSADSLMSEEDFKRQRNIIIDLLHHLPVTFLHHKDYEGDDLIFNMIKYRHSTDECIVISRDTDFIQLINEFSDVKVYEPVTKEMLKTPEYNYISYKSLVGDTADDITGVKGVGKVRADILLKDNNAFNEYMEKNAESKKIFDRNVSLITLADLNDKFCEIDEHDYKFNKQYVHDKFSEYEFETMLTDTYWDKFIKIFE